MDIDTGLPMFDNQEASHLPPGEAFPEAAPEADQPQVAQDDQEMDGADSARVGRRRGPRIIPLDRTQQLRKADLVNWDENYLANMEEARQHKNAYTRSRQAKINAQWFVFGHGLNGVGTCPGLAHVPNPLAMFSGTKLWEAIVGFELETGRKRERSASRSTDSERRTRPRIDDDQPAIHDTIEEDGFMPPFDDDSIERGRHAQPQLDEQSSQMPWNISSRPQSRQTSRQGSALPAIHGVGSVGAAGIGAMAPPGLDPFSRRASRRISSSPLAGRGLPLPEGLDISSDADIGGDTFLGGMASNDPALQDFSFQLHGPAAAVSTQTAAESQWVRTALDAESGRFLEFVRSAQEHNPDPSEVIFQEMLPPEQHTKIVASQAFYHILTLASKGLVKAVQAPEGGDLILSVVEV